MGKSSLVEIYIMLSFKKLAFSWGSEILLISVSVPYKKLTSICRVKKKRRIAKKCCHLLKRKVLIGSLNALSLWIFASLITLQGQSVLKYFWLVNRVYTVPGIEIHEWNHVVTAKIDLCTWPVILFRFKRMQNPH